MSYRVKPYPFRSYQRDQILRTEHNWQRFNRVWKARITGWFQKPWVFWPVSVLGVFAFFAIGALPIE